MGGDARAKKVLICVRYHMWSTKVESPSLEKEKKSQHQSQGVYFQSHHDQRLLHAQD